MTRTQGRTDDRYDPVMISPPSPRFAGYNAQNATSRTRRVYLRSHLHPKAHSPILIILRQALKPPNHLTTIKPPSIRLFRQNPRPHPQQPTPLDRVLGDPSPIEPAPAALEAGHLRLGVHEQPLLVRGGIVRRVRVGVVAFADAAVGRAGRRQDLRRRVARVHGAGPAAAHVDVVEVRRAVCVGLGPFAAEGGAEAGGGGGSVWSVFWGGEGW